MNLLGSGNLSLSHSPPTRLYRPGAEIWLTAASRRSSDHVSVPPWPLVDITMNRPSYNTRGTCNWAQSNARNGLFAKARQSTHSKTSLHLYGEFESWWENMTFCLTIKPRRRWHKTTFDQRMSFILYNMLSDTFGIDTDLRKTPHTIANQDPIPNNQSGEKRVAYNNRQQTKHFTLMYILFNHSVESDVKTSGFNERITGICV